MIFLTYSHLFSPRIDGQLCLSLWQLSVKTRLNLSSWLIVTVRKYMNMYKQKM